MALKQSAGIGVPGAAPTGLDAATVDGQPNLVNHPVIGHLDHDGEGRTDDLPIAVPEGAYVIPADVVSALGQGNTTAGVKKLDAKFGGHVARSGKAGGGAASTPPVDIIAAGGEYIVPPEKVRELGGGDMASGHDILDAFVKRVRDRNIQTLSQLPGPKK